jgi:CHAD domain-containing protein
MICGHVSDLKLNQIDFLAVGGGLKASYSKGRKAMQQSIDNPTDEILHQWRKRVKDHWYHSRLMRNIWPRLMKAYENDMKQLSDLLGDDHDLAVFRRMLEHLPDNALTEPVSNALRQYISDRRNTLQEQAVQLGTKIYPEKPKRFYQRWEVYWNVWQKSH